MRQEIVDLLGREEGYQRYKITYFTGIDTTDQLLIELRDEEWLCGGTRTVLDTPNMLIQVDFGLDHSLIAISVPQGAERFLRDNISNEGPLIDLEKIIDGYRIPLRYEKPS